MTTSISPSGRIRLLSESTRLIKQNLDFKPSHKVPKENNPATSRFVKATALGDINAEMENIWNQCRLEFGYKRKDKVGPLIENGIGMLTLPDFRYNIVVDQDAESPSYAFWRRSVDEVKDLSTLQDSRFNAIFSKSFDILESDFPSPQNVEALIDRVEDLGSPRITVKYPSNGSSCEVFLRDLGISIHVESSSYRICLPNCPSPKTLLEKIIEFQKVLKAQSEGDLILPLL